ncbi:hypothetical protein [Bacillus sp. AK128]
MDVIEGIITSKRMNSSDILVIGDIPVAKFFIQFNGKKSVFSIHCKDEPYEFHLKGLADVYFFEGKQPFYRDKKFVNDFFIEDTDVIELLMQHQGENVKLSMSTVKEDSHKAS